MENPLELDLKPSESSSGQSSADNIEATLAIPETVIATGVKPRWWDHIRLEKIGLFGASLYLFILAIIFWSGCARKFAAEPEWRASSPMMVSV